MPLWMQARPETALFWAAYAVCYLAEALGSFFQKPGPADKRRDRRSHAVIVAGTAVSLFLAFCLAAALPRLRMSAEEGAMLVAGAALILCGVAFRWYAIWVLGRFFTRTVAIREGHRIVRDGPYRLLRHPSYTGYLIAVLGLAIALDNGAAALVLLVFNVAIYAYRIRVEEAAMAEEFGDVYRTYQRQTWCLLPLIF